MVGLVLCLGSSTAGAGPRQVWLWFADGTEPPATSPPFCPYGMSPPPYTCRFGETPAVCKAMIQRLLDRWYADFNLVFTYQRPSTGPYDTIIVTSDRAWCLVSEQLASKSPFPSCEGSEAGAIVVFQCRDDAHTCASIIGQEQAHLIGLEHTPSPTDIMNAQFLPHHDGFEDRDSPVGNVACRRLQNSYRLMLERLGSWPGGPKPSLTDLPAAPADAAAVADSSGAPDAATSEGRPPDMPVGGDAGAAAMGDDGAAVNRGAGQEGWNARSRGCVMAAGGFQTTWEAYACMGWILVVIGRATRAAK